MFTARAIPAVQPPVAGDDVHFPVPIQVRHVHTIPPSQIPLHPQVLRHFPQLPSLIVKYSDRPPFTCQHQVRLPVPVQIAEHSPADHSHLLQPLLDNQPPVFVLQQQRIARLRIPTGHHPSTHEQIQVPVPIHIRQRQRPNASL